MPTSIKLDPKLKARIDAIAKMQRRSPHWIMVEAIRLYVEREERRQKTDDPPPPWSSLQDRAQDEIAGAPGKAEEDNLPPLRHWSEVLNFIPNPNPPDPEREKAWERFKKLQGAGAELGGGRTKEEIDAYIRWLRDDRN
jgi:hypothetical protein